MSAEASTSIGGGWARLQGQVVDGRFPLRRFLGGSEHSGVFVTESAKLAPSDVALKLVTLPVARVDSQLARWHAAAALSHPNLIRLLGVGRCNVAGFGNLYAAMEYADQDLAQLLQRRALTEEEAREMLVPMLSALAFLHERKLVSGRLKPSNVLVVGDRLKLASDSIRAVGEVDDVEALSAYDPPEAREGRCSTASDVWALGVTICEALTRRQPLGLLGGAGTVVLPPDLPAAFGGIVAWCLRRQPEDRPDVAQIDAWLSGQPVEVELAAGLEGTAPPKPIPPAPTPVAPRPVTARLAPASSKPASAPTASKSKLVEPPPPAPVSRVRIDEGDVVVQPRRSLVPLALGVVVVIAVVWGGIRLFGGHESSRPSVGVASSGPGAPGREQSDSPSVSDGPSTLSEQGASAALPTNGSSRVSASEPAARSTVAAGAATNASSAAVRKFIPEVSPRARRTIRGNVRVSVRVIVEQDGSVFAALAEHRGPSRYFERVAVEAVKKWTFTPADAAAQRLMLVKFAFNREGTTAEAVPLD